MEEIDLAFEWLDKAYEDHEVEMYWLKVEPPFSPLQMQPMPWRKAWKLLMVSLVHIMGEPG